MGFALGVIQMVLYAIYRNGNKVKKASSLEEGEEVDTTTMKQLALHEPIKNVNLVVLSNNEVFPDPSDNNNANINNNKNVEACPV